METTTDVIAQSLQLKERDHSRSFLPRVQESHRSSYHLFRLRDSLDLFNLLRLDALPTHTE